MKVSSIQANLSKNYQDNNLKDKSRNLFAKKDFYNTESRRSNPSFGGLGMATLGLSSSIMQWIESKGYLVSFLIQDGLGMTTPRVWTGFHRDKDITGEYNFQEGFEVLGREGLTGPYIIGVAPLVLALTGKFCKSTNTNTRLIKRLGQNFKDMVKAPGFDNSLKGDAEKFKQEFYKFNINKMYKDTVPNDANAENTVKYLVSEFEKYASNDKKASKEALQNIVNTINDKMIENSDKLLGINKLKVGDANNIAAFNSSEVLRALKDFGDDAISRNKDISQVDEKSIENIKNNFATKRLLTNIANIVVTLGGLSVLPKLYAKSDVSPGAKALEQAKQRQGVVDKKDGEVSFKGKGINSDGIFAKLGHLITKNVPEKVHDLLEYTGYNFSKTTFALLSTFGMILPRARHAWNRAKVEENGKRDRTEINEILLRDTTSALSVVFAVPLLTKALVKSYEDKTGFVLTNRASDGKSAFKKFIDIINPYSDLDVLSVADLNSVYGNIDSKAKLMNFSKFVDDKGGDLAKILSKSENVSSMFNENTFTLDSIKNLSRKEKNAKIINLFNKMSVSDPKAKNEAISKLMKGAGDIKHNRIAKMARGLNSLPGAISTIIISPILLGFFIPLLTYHNTRKANAKKLESSQSV